MVNSNILEAANLGARATTAGMALGILAEGVKGDEERLRRDAERECRLERGKERKGNAGVGMHLDVAGRVLLIASVDFWTMGSQC